MAYEAVGQRPFAIAALRRSIAQCMYTAHLYLVLAKLLFWAYCKIEANENLQIIIRAWEEHRAMVIMYTFVTPLCLANSLPIAVNDSVLDVKNLAPMMIGLNDKTAGDVFYFAGHFLKDIFLWKKKVCYLTLFKCYLMYLIYIYIYIYINYKCTYIN